MAYGCKHISHILLLRRFFFLLAAKKRIITPVQVALPCQRVNGFYALFILMHECIYIYHIGGIRNSRT